MALAYDPSLVNLKAFGWRRVPSFTRYPFDYPDAWRRVYAWMFARRNGRARYAWSCKRLW